MGGGPGWIGTQAELVAALSRIARGPIALDTEGDSLHHYPDKVCLVQLSYAGCDLLIDPLAALDLKVLAPLLGDRSIVKILHGADYDIRCLQRDFSLEIAGLFDTMVAARMLGERPFGLAALLERFLGVKLDKRFQKADWSRRPLTQAMLSYAANDTRHLQDLAAELTAGLRRLGRLAWAEEEFRLLERVRWSNGARDEEPFRTIKGSSRLGPLELAVLRDLHALRERMARARNRPPFMIMRNEVLLELACRQPDDPAGLDQIKGLPALWKRDKRRCRELLEAIERARALSPEEFPAVQRRSRKERRSGSFLARQRTLRTRRDEVAAELGLEPSFLASQAVLESAQETLDREGNLANFTEFRDWQAELLRTAFERSIG